MSRRIITSRDNPLVKHARAVRDGKVRESIFIEGVRLCEEAINAALAIEDVFYTERIAQDERGSHLLQTLNNVGLRATQVSEQALASISETKTPQGIIMLAARPRTDSLIMLNEHDEPPLLLVMHRISNPANAGAILRTAEAAGATGAITTAGSTDILSPKALRGAMGSGFRLPLWANAQYSEIVDWCAEHRISMVCADVRATHSYTDLDWTSPRALIVGPEATGLSNDEVAAADEAVFIPMRAPVESLNVAVASAVMLYEAARQRAKGKR